MGHNQLKNLPRIMMVRDSRVWWNLLGESRFNSHWPLSFGEAHVSDITSSIVELVMILQYIQHTCIIYTNIWLWLCGETFWLSFMWNAPLVRGLGFQHFILRFNKISLLCRYHQVECTTCSRFRVSAFHTEI